MAAGSISPGAQATPSAEAPRDKPIDFSVSIVATVLSRAAVSAIRGDVRSRHFTWTKCTAAGSSRPAFAVASHRRHHLHLLPAAEMLRRQGRRVRDSDR